jgi:amino acid transporter
MSTSAGSSGSRDTDRGYTDGMPHRTEAIPNNGTEDRGSVVEREREEHGGVKIGSAFFGFLTAVGVGVLLTALVTAAGTAVGLATKSTTDEITSSANKSASTIGIAGGIVVLVILFVAYYCGGYVASRMARFDGVKQGIAVWAWALLVAVLLAILGAVAGEKYNVLSQLNSFPRIPVSEGDLTTGGIIAAVAVVLVSLIGAVVGGLAGMRFHRRVDRTGLSR